MTTHLRPPRLRRRHLCLGAATLAMGALLAGCRGAPVGPDAPAASPRDLPAGELIIDTRSGRAVSRAALLQALRGADLVLLGEQHDNTLHHQRRGELLAALQPAAVVAEQLPAGSLAHFGSPAGAAAAAGAPDLLPPLTAAGFDARGWRWPLHAPLFAAVAQAGLPLVGGNLPRDEARRVAREGEAAVPPGLARLLAEAPLAASAQAALDSALVQGHCGQLAGPRLVGMRWAQRARDAALAQALLAARAAGAPGPVVLLAGNGHVRNDHGVPVLLVAQQPAPRVVSVGFVEGPAVAAASLPYTFAWHTSAPAGRGDPCAAFTLPAAAPSSAPGPR